MLAKQIDLPVRVIGSSELHLVGLTVLNFPLKSIYKFQLLLKKKKKRKKKKKKKKRTTN